MKMTGMLVGNNLGKVQALGDHVVQQLSSFHGPLCVVGVQGRVKN